MEIVVGLLAARLEHLSDSWAIRQILLTNLDALA